MNIYYIGGSPCSGKSTIAQILSERYHLHYFKVDDYLDSYTEMGALANRAICSKLGSMNAEETWMRDPVVQCEEELAYYQEIFDYIKEDLKKSEGNCIITEGAAYLPELMKESNIPSHHYLSVTPAKAFQISHYKEREWVPYVLKECADKEKAFANWMERDVLFAKAVQEQCKTCGYYGIINDGTVRVSKLVEQVAAWFELEQ
ncbi:MAG TPA: hypothetical protein PLQ04_08155 [Lachnospiraceae bacterium]|nr:hypothetical protein [Lachnospiraceae bacterium]